jgi:hypothetical protein|nr:MAG TPA: hypothetical protein [Caudoviricetes sp.]
MTKEDIKKAFVICCGAQDCTGCPILDMEKRNKHGCKFNLFMSVFDIVAEQEKEIERLKTTLGQCNTELNSALESLKSQCREIGELKAKIKQAQIDVLNNVKDVLTNQKHECLERNNLTGYSAICECEKYVDELIKEIRAQ